MRTVARRGPAPLRGALGTSASPRVVGHLRLCDASPHLACWPSTYSVSHSLSLLRILREGPWGPGWTEFPPGAPRGRNHLQHPSNQWRSSLPPELYGEEPGFHWLFLEPTFSLKVACRARGSPESLPPGPSYAAGSFLESPGASALNGRLSQGH